MAFELFTRELLARADEARDPGSGDAYLRLSYASETTLKLSAMTLLSEGVYRYGQEVAKKNLEGAITGRIGWASVFEIAGRMPAEHEYARILSTPPPNAARLHELTTQLANLMEQDANVKIGKMPPPAKIAWRNTMRILTTLRNKLKGHGAPPPEFYPKLNPLLREFVGMAVADVLDRAPPALAYLRPTRDGQGLFLLLGSPAKETELPVSIPTLQPGDIVLQSGPDLLPLVPLAYFEALPRKLWLYNDLNNESTGELEYIDYREGQHGRQPGHFVQRHGFAELPESETSAAPVLRTDEGALIPNNLPPRRRGHVSRPALEVDLAKYVLDETHRIVTLDGRGGAGKTYAAVEVCHRIATDPSTASRFTFIVWVSGRDIDLTASGPKPVRQDVVTFEDVMRFVLRAAAFDKEADTLGPQELRRQFIEVCKGLSPLIVIDNFETYADPDAFFQELDDLLPLRTKALITSRHKKYRGEYPFTVGSMTEQESFELIRREARSVFKPGLFESEDSVRRCYEAAQGHAYSMRLIVRQVGNGLPIDEACKVVVTQEKVLAALFERSLRMAEPADVEIAAVLAELRAPCPLEALMLLPMSREDIEGAVGRLTDLSLVEPAEEPVLVEHQLVCPRATGEYIRQQGVLESPETRKRIESLATRLRQYAQRIRALAKSSGPGKKTRGQAADVMLGMTRGALEKGDHDVARRAVDLALAFDGDNASVVGEAAMLLRRAGFTKEHLERVDGMFGRALELDPTNAQAWLDWAQHKKQSHAPVGQLMTCYERALEADPTSLGAALGFAQSVMEVVAQEKKLGAGAARVSDKRTARALLAKARNLVVAHLARRERDPAVRDKLRLALAWIALEQEGPSESVRGLVRSLSESPNAPKDVSALREAMMRAEAGQAS